MKALPDHENFTKRNRRAQPAIAVNKNDVRVLNHIRDTMTMSMARPAARILEKCLCLIPMYSMMFPKRTLPR